MGNFMSNQPVISPPSTDLVDKPLICLYFCENFRSIGHVFFDL